MNRLEGIEGNEWDLEPSMQSVEGDGYHVMVVRHPHLKTLNGYVGVDRSHPWFGEHFDNSKLRNVIVHGGLTFSQKGGFDNFKKKYWYLGFDTSHAGDLIPSMIDIAKKHGIPSLTKSYETYRNFDYVLQQTVNLLEQVKEAKVKNPDYVHTFFHEYRKIHRQRMREKRMRTAFDGFLMG
jgi:hypothetical protein